MFTRPMFARTGRITFAFGHARLVKSHTGARPGTHQGEGRLPKSSTSSSSSTGDRSAGDPISAACLDRHRRTLAGDLELCVSGCRVLVFGIDHAKPRPEVANAILSLSPPPATVVFETAMNAAHGKATGAVFPNDAAPLDFRSRLYMKLGQDVEEELIEGRSSLWSQLAGAAGGAAIGRPGPLPAEALAYIASIARGVPLVYGDRPKATTYHRLLDLGASALDKAFGHATELNYLDMLEPKIARRLAASAAVVMSRGADDCPVHRVMVAERDAVLCASLRTAAVLSPGGTVVGVVGSEHIDGIHAGWAGGWVSGAPPVTARDDSTPTVDGSPGLRRALLESVLRVACSPEVVMDAAAVLSALVPDGDEDYETTAEVYGAPRMLLAAVSSALLTSVVCTFPHGDRSLASALDDLRAVRPVNGGTGSSASVLNMLRGLHFELG